MSASAIGAQQLVQVLRQMPMDELRHTMPELEQLWLNGNQIGDDGAKALAAAFAEGAMPKLEKLYLEYNQIGDDGAVALAEAVGKGALPELKELYLERNKLSQTAYDAWEAVEAKRRGLSVYT